MLKPILSRHLGDWSITMHITCRWSQVQNLPSLAEHSEKSNCLDVLTVCFQLGVPKWFRWYDKSPKTVEDQSSKPIFVLLGTAVGLCLSPFHVDHQILFRGRPTGKKGSSLCRHCSLFPSRASQDNAGAKAFGNGCRKRRSKKVFDKKQMAELRTSQSVVDSVWFSWCFPPVPRFDQYRLCVCPLPKWSERLSGRSLHFTLIDLEKGLLILGHATAYILPTWKEHHEYSVLCKKLVGWH